ncbi:MAG TPA: UDP-N-acetylmuramoyl-L-alanyl-D-glutamate--2,6-diaminopimelate ligase, partial [Chloroflexota bacterium]
VEANPGTEVTGIAYDSRRVQAGNIFVAIKGAHYDGTRFVGEAQARGAVAVAAEEPLALPPGLGLITAPNVRAALGEMAAALLGDPSEHLRLIGVTGTDGKTTTCRLIAALLAASGRKTGWFTTVDLGIGETIEPNPFGRTTPEASDLQQILARFVGEQVEDAVIEVSSHALALDRVAGCTFDAAVFTNLAPEHLDFHGSLEAYTAAKAHLFELLGTPTGKRWSRMGVVNADDPASLAIATSSPAGIVSYALENAADVTARQLDLSMTESRFTLVTPLGEARVSTRLVGRHNVMNWLAATAVGLGWGIDLAMIADAAESVDLPPGRLQFIRRGQPFDLVIDFAHTPQAMSTMLDLLRENTRGRLYLLFGLAGHRDASNRLTMGAIATAKTDFFVISTDDPEDEDPAAIAGAIASGARAAGAKEGRDYIVELNRQTAIREVMGRAHSGDVVLLAGKGHEQRMLLASGPQAWSDETEAVQALHGLGYD